MEGQDDIRPLVGRAVSNRGAWLFGGVLGLAAIGLFTALEARRAEVVSPATAPLRGPEPGLIAAGPPLALPPLDLPQQYAEAMPFALQRQVIDLQGRRMPAGLAGLAGQDSGRQLAAPIIPDRPRLRQYPAFYDPNSPDPPVYPQAVQPVVAQPVAAVAEPRLAGGALGEGRVGATRYVNPATSVPQGTVIQAVLETALDSTRPGFARAIVSRDVRSFDGTRILVPRGSRLFGEYKADLTSGQNRVLVQWQRLTRPDGVQIALDSPSADPLGQAGIKGKVNSHFLARFSGAILQSALEIGVNLATQRVSDGTVVIGLPGSTQSLVAPAAESVRPTLKVRHGASIAVFVARDLDFTAVEP